MCAYKGKKVVDCVRSVLNYRAELREIVRGYVEEGARFDLPTELNAAFEVLARDGNVRGVELLQAVADEVREDVARAMRANGEVEWGPVPRLFAGTEN